MSRRTATTRRLLVLSSEASRTHAPSAQPSVGELSTRAAKAELLALVREARQNGLEGSEADWEAGLLSDDVAQRLEAARRLADCLPDEGCEPLSLDWLMFGPQWEPEPA